MRERQKRREYEAYEDHEAERKEEQAKERKKIAAFLEDYEDERDDEKYYRGMTKLHFHIDLHLMDLIFLQFLTVCVACRKNPSSYPKVTRPN